MWNDITLNEQIRIRNMENYEYEVDGVSQTLIEIGIKVTLWAAIIVRLGVVKSNYFEEDFKVLTTLTS